MYVFTRGTTWWSSMRRIGWVSITVYKPPWIMCTYLPGAQRGGLQWGGAIPEEDRLRKHHQLPQRDWHIRWGDRQDTVYYFPAKNHLPLDPNAGECCSQRLGNGSGSEQNWVTSTVSGSAADPGLLQIRTLNLMKKRLCNIFGTLSILVPDSK